jgi:TPR repeat protein
LIVGTFLAPGVLVHADEFDDPVQSAMEDRDYTKAFRLTKIDAERGDPKAMGNLGLLYEKGLGTPVDLKLAAQWLQRAARKGDASAQNNLGFLYFKGLGVKQDHALALKWFLKAAKQGLASAEGNLGLLYGGGFGVPRDDAKALEWFKKAAEQDDLDAQVNLAHMLSLGQGAPQDNVAAYQWFYLALQHENLEDTRKTELREDLQWLEKHMSEAEVDQARQRASAWKPASTPSAVLSK